MQVSLLFISLMSFFVQMWQTSRTISTNFPFYSIINPFKKTKGTEISLIRGLLRKTALL